MIANGQLNVHGLTWDRRMLSLAKHVASWSKDPSTQTGAVITDQLHRMISVGFNGFPRGIADDGRLQDRETKYKIIVHCERNAIIFAGRSLQGCVLYTWPFMSCSVCAAMVIQAGIGRCVAPLLPNSLKERWGDDVQLATSLFNEAGVQLDLMEFE